MDGSMDFVGCFWFLLFRALMVAFFVRLFFSDGHFSKFFQRNNFNLCNTNEIICNVTARYGTGIDVFNERDTLAISPCLFGYQEGLEIPSQLTSETNLYAVKYFNNTLAFMVCIFFIPLNGKPIIQKSSMTTSSPRTTLGCRIAVDAISDIFK